MDDSTPIIDVTAHPHDFVPNDDFWAFLRRRKGSITLFWLFALMLSFWWLLRRPNLFAAESRVMIVRTGSGGPISEAELASEIELIRDPSHLNKTAAKLRPNQSDTQVHDLQRRIDAGLSAGLAGKSTVVAIQYRDPDPADAARVVNQIVDFYLADRRYVFQTSGRAPTDSSPVAPGDLLSAFDAINHGPILRSELESRLQRRIDLEAHLAEIKAQIRDHQEAVGVLRKRLASIPQNIHSRTRTRITGNPAAKQVEDTEIVNPLKQQIESLLLANETAVAGLQARVQQTSTALREAQSAEDHTSALSSERDKMERRVQDARGPNDSPADRPNLRATLLNRAERPYGPLPKYTALWSPLAILGSLLLAFIIAWLIDQFDKPIYTSGDFHRASGVPPMDNLGRGASA